MTNTEKIINRTAKDITEDITGRLPSASKSVRLKQLASVRVPDFLFSRIQLEAERNLVASFVMPETEWADTDHKNVRNAWSDLLYEVKKDLRFPLDEAAALIGPAVRETLSLLICPREKLPGILFGGEESLTREALNERAKNVVANRHLAMAPVRYLYRKNLDSLTIDQCRNIVTQVDEKLISRYDISDWMNLLVPVFQLADDSVDSRLLSLFFRDKKRPHVAGKLFELHSAVTWPALKKIVSIPGILDQNRDADTTGRHTDAGWRHRDSGESDDSGGSGDSGRYPLHMFGRESSSGSAGPGLGRQANIAASSDMKSRIHAGEDENSEDGAFHDESEATRRTGRFIIEGQDNEDRAESPSDRSLNEEQFAESYGREAESRDRDEEKDHEDDIPLHKRFALDDQPTLYEVADDADEGDSDDGSSDEFEEYHNDDFEEYHNDDIDTYRGDGHAVGNSFDYDYEEAEGKSARTDNSADLHEHNESLNSFTSKRPQRYTAYDETDDNLEEPDESGNGSASEREERRADFDKYKDYREHLIQKGRDKQHRDLQGQNSREERIEPADVPENRENRSKWAESPAEREPQAEQPNGYEKRSGEQNDDSDKKGEQSGFGDSSENRSKWTDHPSPAEQNSLLNREDVEDRDDQEDQEGYIWQKFITEESGYGQDEPDESYDEPEAGSDDHHEEPASGNTTLAGGFQEEDSTSFDELMEWLEKDAGRFAAGVFNGSAGSFTKAVKDLSELDDWKAAAGYIKMEVFARYDVDMYDEVAVDFTDRLHAWFTENGFKTTNS